MLTEGPVADEVLALVRHCLPPSTNPDDVVVDATLDEEGLGFDSVGLIDLLCECEERFGVSLPPEVLLDEGSSRLAVGDLIAEIAARLDGSTQ